MDEIPGIGGLAGEEQALLPPSGAAFRTKMRSTAALHAAGGRTDGSAASRATSSSSVTPFASRRRARHELIAAALGDKKLRLGRIVLDLLPQTINMRLQRVRGHVGVIAPDVLEQRLARDRLLFGAMEVAQDRGFFLGQPQFDALLVDKVLRSGPKGVRADLKLRVLARFILPKLRADAGKQHHEPERLADIIVGPGIKAGSRRRHPNHAR